jgi:alpha-tubulin suppressor-like RCC1 family protein
MIELPNVADVAVGTHHYLALTTEGTVVSWGTNFHGQLGRRLLPPGSWKSSTPGEVKLADTAVAIAAGHEFSIALLKGGSVTQWGRVGFRNGGPQGQAARPVEVPRLPRITSVATGLLHCVAVSDTGELWTWGTPSGTAMLSAWGWAVDAVPRRIEGITGVVAVACGDLHSLALRRDGSVWAWGNNSYGQLGDGSNGSREKPEPIEGLPRIAALAAGGTRSMALGSDGTVWAWGNANEPPLSSRPVPAEVSGLEGTVLLSASVGSQEWGGGASFAVTGDGRVRIWGTDSWGLCGRQEVLSIREPKEVAGVARVCGVVAGHREAFVWCGPKK